MLKNSLKRACVNIKDFEKLKEEIIKLRKQVKKLEKANKSATDEVQYNGLTEVQLTEKCVKYIKPYDAVSFLLNHLFTKEEICNFSVSGKLASKTTAPRPPFPRDRYNIIRAISCQHLGLTNPQLTLKVHAVQKCVRKNFK